MADIRTLLDALVLEYTSNPTNTNKIEVKGLADEQDYHNLRTALSKKWNEYKEVLLAVGDDGTIQDVRLCSDYEPLERSATFFLGRARRKEARQFSFAIIPSSPTATTTIATNDESADTDIREVSGVVGTNLEP